MLSECPCGCVLVPPTHHNNPHAFTLSFSVVKGSLIKIHLRAVIGEQDSRKPAH
jgi:hypothetical protein